MKQHLKLWMVWIFVLYLCLLCACTPAQQIPKPPISSQPGATSQVSSEILPPSSPTSSSPSSHPVPEMPVFPQSLRHTVEGEIGSEILGLWEDKIYHAHLPGETEVLVYDVLQGINRPFGVELFHNGSYGSPQGLTLAGEYYRWNEYPKEEDNWQTRLMQVDFSQETINSIPLEGFAHFLPSGYAVADSSTFYMLGHQPTGYGNPYTDYYAQVLRVDGKTKTFRLFLDGKTGLWEEITPIEIAANEQHMFLLCRQELDAKADSYAYCVQMYDTSGNLQKNYALPHFSRLYRYGFTMDCSEDILWFNLYDAFDEEYLYKTYAFRVEEDTLREISLPMQSKNLQLLNLHQMLFDKQAFPYVYLYSKGENAWYLFDVDTEKIYGIRLLEAKEDSRFSFATDMNGNLLLEHTTGHWTNSTTERYYYFADDIVKYMQSCQFEESQ